MMIGFKPVRNLLLQTIVSMAYFIYQNRDIHLMNNVYHDFHNIKTNLISMMEY